MSGPAPVVIQFVTKDLDKVLKAMKSIADVVNGTEQKSVAAAKAGASEREKAATAETKKRVSAVVAAENSIQSARMAGLGKAVEAFQKEAAEARKHLNKHLSDVAYTSTVKQRMRKAEQAEIARSQAVQHAGAVNYFKEEIKVADNAAKHRTALRERIATDNGKFAAKQAADEAKLSRQLAAERHHIALEKRRGVGPTNSASTSHAARLSLLDSAEGKTHQERSHIAEKARGLREMAKIDRDLYKKGRQEEIDGHKGVTRALEQEEAKRLALRERADQKAQGLAAKQAAEGERRRETFANTVMGAGSRGIKNATSIIGSAGRQAFGAVTDAGGGFSVQDSIQQRLATDKEWALVGVNAVDPVTGKQLHPDTAKARAKARETSIRTNTSELDLAKGIQVYQGRAGEVESGIRNMDFFAKTSKTMGESVETVMELGGQLRAQNKKLDDAGMRKLVLDTMQQARVTSLNPIELARQGGKATAGAVDWVGDQAENQKRMLGLVGFAAPVAGGAAEAATAVNSISQDANQNRDAVEKFLGAGAFDKKSGRINMRQEDFIANVIAAAGSKRGGLGGEDDEDLGLIGRSAAKGGMGFGRRSIKVFRAARQTWNEAIDSGKSQSEAKAAVLSEMKKATEATYDPKDMEKDFAEIMKTSAEQFGAAVNELKVQVGDALVPQLIKLIPVLQELTPPLVKVLSGFVELAAWMAQNPLLSIVGIILGSIGKEIAAEVAAAKLGEFIKSLLTPAAPPPTGVPGAGGGPVAGAGGAGALMTMGAGIAMQAGAIAGLGDETMGAMSSGQAAAKKIAGGLASSKPEEVAAAQAQLASAQEQSTTERTAAAWADRAIRGVGTVINPAGYFTNKAADWAAEKVTGTSGGKQTLETLKANEIVNAPELQKVISATIAAGVQEGMQQGLAGVSNPGDPKRGQSITKRTSE